MEVVKCVKGHFYDKLSGECPQCKFGNPSAATVSLIREDNFCVDELGIFNFVQEQKAEDIFPGSTEITDLKNTLFYSMYNGMCYHLWLENNQFYLGFRRYRRDLPVVLENITKISQEGAMTAAREILRILEKEKRDDIFVDSRNPYQKSRLYLNTRQLRCDYQWTIGFSDSSRAYWIMQDIYRVLGSRMGRMDADLEQYMAELEIGHTIYQLKRKDNQYALKVQELIYYQFTNMFKAEASVMLSYEEAEELMTGLMKSGILEAMIHKNQRPGDNHCFDPGFATGFYIKYNDLTFTYRDWNKADTEGEGSAVSAAENVFREILMRNTHKK